MLKIGLVCCIVTAVLISFIPQNFISADVSGDAVLNIDLSQMPLLKVIDIDDIQNAEDIDDVNTQLEINGISYGVVELEKQDNAVTIYAKADSYKVDISMFKWFFIPIILFLVSSLVVVHFIGKLCKTFQLCNTPFTDEVVDALKKLAVSIIPMALLQSVSESVTNSIMTGDIDIVLGVDLMTVILVVLIFLLAAVFNYGTMLQKESDETL